MIVLGLDPGTSNFGYAYIAYTEGKLKIVDCGVLSKIITNLTDKPQKVKGKSKKGVVKEYPPFTVQMSDFYNYWNKGLIKYSPTEVVAERFQSRGLRGKSIESVSIMLGALSVLCKSKHINIFLLMAATWKNKTNKYTELDQIYKEVSIPNHIVDAAFIAVYRISIIYNIDYTILVDQLYKELLNWT